VHFNTRRPRLVLVFKSREGGREGGTETGGQRDLIGGDALLHLHSCKDVLEPVSSLRWSLCTV
jgi:hypothetical protein